MNSFWKICFGFQVTLVLLRLIRSCIFVCSQVMFDLMLAIGSCMVVGILICFQTWSLWIGALGVFGIFMSFIEANVIYRIVLNYR